MRRRSFIAATIAMLATGGLPARRFRRRVITFKDVRVFVNGKEITGFADGDEIVHVPFAEPAHGGEWRGRAGGGVWTTKADLAALEQEAFERTRGRP